MINVLKLLAVTVTVSLPSALMAQQSGDITAPFGHTRKHLMIHPSAKLPYFRNL